MGNKLVTFTDQQLENYQVNYFSICPLVTFLIDLNLLGLYILHEKRNFEVSTYAFAELFALNFQAIGTNVIDRLMKALISFDFFFYFGSHFEVGEQLVL